MTPEFKNKLRDEFREYTNREPLPHEDMNMENDFILVNRVLLKEVEEIKEKLKKIQ